MMMGLDGFEPIFFFFFTLIDDVISEVNTREAKQRKKTTRYAITNYGYETNWLYVLQLFFFHP